METRKSLEKFWSERFANLISGNYEAVYNSYHKHAPFRKNFSTGHEYVRFAKAQLSAIEVKDWAFLKFRKLSEEQVECLIIIQLVCDETVQYFYEMALIMRCDQGWYYHSAQKSIW